MKQQNKNEWVIHIWGKKRDKLELTNVEKFHIDILDRLQEQQKKFDKILINIALDDINDKKLLKFLKSELKKVLYNDNVVFKSCQNESKFGEYVTFRPYVFDRIGEDVNIFYSHFKGYRSYIMIYRESFPVRVIDLCEMFWSYVMYMKSMDFDDVQDKLNNGKGVYCWFLLKEKEENLDPVLDNYYILYQKTLQENLPEIKDYIYSDLCKHSPGSFCWYNMKQIGESLKDKSLVRNITTDDLTNKNDLHTHFCELYLMQFLSDDECYSVADYSKDWKEVRNALYLDLYPSKKVCRELIGDFEKYLIDNKLI